MHDAPLGDFTSAVPDENNICKVPTMSASEQNIPEVPGEGGATVAVVLGEVARESRYIPTKTVSAPRKNRPMLRQSREVRRGLRAVMR